MAKELYCGPCDDFHRFGRRDQERMMYWLLENTPGRDLCLIDLLHTADDSHEVHEALRHRARMLKERAKLRNLFDDEESA